VRFFKCTPCCFKGVVVGVRLVSLTVERVARYAYGGLATVDFMRLVFDASFLSCNCERFAEGFYFCISHDIMCWYWF